MQTSGSFGSSISDMPAVKTDRLNEFQTAALEELQHVLTKHGLSCYFVVKAGVHPTAWATFVHSGEEYTLAVFTHEINLRQGPNLYECFLKSEFTSDAILIASFAHRLDRFLSCGDWSLPDESSSYL